MSVEPKSKCLMQMEFNDIKWGHILLKGCKNDSSPNVIYSFSGSFNLSHCPFFLIIKFLQNLNGNAKSYE